MRRLIWIPIAVLLGLLDGVFSATFGLSGIGFSLVIVGVVGLFVSGRYPVSIFFAVVACLIKHLLSGVSLGWMELFSSLVVTLAGVVRYFVGVSEKWIEWVSGGILLVALYFFELLVTRNFDTSAFANLSGVSVWGVVLWIISNIVSVVFLGWIFNKLGKWVENEE